MSERIAVCPGSFDPVTIGHIDIIRRAATLFDKVIVLVVINPVKNTSFTPEERVALIRKSVAEIPNVEVDLYKGLLVDYVRSKGAVAIVKGLRAMSDFEYEFQMALINKRMPSLCRNHLPHHRHKQPLSQFQSGQKCGHVRR